MRLHCDSLISRRGVPSGSAATSAIRPGAAPLRLPAASNTDAGGKLLHLLHASLISLCTVTLLIARSLCAQPLMEDSLALKILELDIAKARVSVSHLDFWHRLIPQMSLSASYGVNDLLWINPSTASAVAMPRDAYRLTLTLSLSGLLDGSKQTLQELEIEQLLTRYALLQHRQRATLEERSAKLRALQEEQRALGEQLRLAREVLRYRATLFSQGKLHYDLLVRSRQDVLNAQRALAHTGTRAPDDTPEVLPADLAAPQDTVLYPGDRP